MGRLYSPVMNRALLSGLTPQFGYLKILSVYLEKVLYVYYHELQQEAGILLSHLRVGN
jgi:hypothetical protein